MMQRIVRILIVDDNDRFRQRLRAFLASEPDIEIVGEASDGREAMDKVRELGPDLVIMDVRMPGMNGVTATRQLKAERPDLKIIMLTVFDLEEYREVAAASGADDYVTKRSLTEELVPVIRHVCSGLPRDGETAKKPGTCRPGQGEAAEALHECEEGLRQLSDAAFRQMVLQEKASIIRALARTNSLIRAQRDLAVALGAASRLDEGLHLCFEAALQTAGMDCGGIYLVDGDSGALDLVLHQALSPELIPGISHYDANSEPTRLVMAGKPVYTERLALPVPLYEAESRENRQATAIVPMCHGGRVLGCLYVASHSLDEVPDSARQALEAMAIQMGGAIARLRSEEELQKHCAHLQELVEERTAQLQSINEQLQAEIAARQRAEKALRVSHERLLITQDEKHKT